MLLCPDRLALHHLANAFGEGTTRNLGGSMSKTCNHLDSIQDVTPSAKGCEECLAMGDRWVHLRMCLSCGHVGCCDSSKNKHATKHFLATNHPIVQSVEPGENWRWCYIDQTLIR